MTTYLEVSDDDELVAWQSYGEWKVECPECEEDLDVETWPYKNPGLLHHAWNEPNECQYSTFCQHSLGGTNDEASNNFMSDTGPMQTVLKIKVCVVCQTEI